MARTDRDSRPRSHSAPTPSVTLASLGEPILRQIIGDLEQLTRVLDPKSTHLWPAKLIRDLFRIKEFATLSIAILRLWTPWRRAREQADFSHTIA